MPYDPLAPIRWRLSTPPQRTIRSLLFDIGLSLLHRGREDHAAENFAMALDEEGEEPANSVILLHRAYALDGLGEEEQAFRAYLEAVQGDAEMLECVLLRVHDLLSASVAIMHGEWLAQEWLPSVLAAQQEPRWRMHAHFLLGRVRLFAGEQAEAFPAFGAAVREDQAAATAAGEEFLRGSELPSAFGPEELDSDGHLVLARLYHLLGCGAEALAHVDTALGERPTDAGDDVVAPVFELRGSILCAAGLEAEAAQSFFEASRSFAWQGQLDRADALLEKAVLLGKRDRLTYWTWAQALLDASYRPSPPYVDEQQLARALHVWTQGLGEDPVDENFSRGYVTRALIAEMAARLQAPVEQRESWWLGVTYLERAVLVNSEDADLWATLASLHRLLGNESVAFANVEQALKRDPFHVAALDERIAIQAQRGQFEAALEDIEHRAEEGQTPWVNAIQAYILVRRGAYEEAAKRVEDLVEQFPDELWYRLLLAICHQQWGDSDAALAQYRLMWDRYPPVIPNDASLLATAAYQLGHYDSAIELLEHVLSDEIDAMDTYSALGIAYLARGDERRDDLRQGEDCLQRAVAFASNPCEFDDLTEIDLPELTARVAGRSHEPSVRQILAQLAPRIERQRRATLVAPSPIEELEQSARSEGGKRDGGWYWLGARAGLARVYCDVARWADAVAVYQEIWDHQSASGEHSFPEILIGMARALEGLIAAEAEQGRTQTVDDARGRLVGLGLAEELTVRLAVASHYERQGYIAEAEAELREATALVGAPRDEVRLFESAGDLAFRRDRLHDARDAYLAGLERATAVPDLDAGYRFQAALACLAASQGDSVSAAEHLRAGLRWQMPTTSWVRPRSSLGQAFAAACAKYVRSAGTYTVLAEGLRRMADDPLVSPELRREARGAAFHLAKDQHREHNKAGSAHVDEEAALRLITQAPIDLEADAGLFPQDKDTPEVIRMLKVDIPALRERVLTDTGIRLPGIRISASDDLWSGGYVVYVHGVPYARGQVRQGHRYCPNRARCVAFGIEGIPEATPELGEGLWLPDDALEGQPVEALDLWDSYELMIRRSEGVIRRRISMFMGVQELVNQLNEWRWAEAEDTQRLLAEEVTRDSSMIRYLTGIAKHLLSEGVSVADTRTIVATAVPLRRQGCPQPEAAEAVLRVLRPARSPADTRQIIHVLELEVALARHVCEFDDDRYVVLPDMERQRLLDLVDRAMGTSRPESLALRVSNPGLRAHVRRLVEDRFPTLAVLADQENAEGPQ